MIQEQDIVVFQGRGDERLALGQSISHPEKEKHPDIPWQEMVGMRNVLTHEYFRVKPTILFETVTSQFKLLEHQLEELQIEYP